MFLKTINFYPDGILFISIGVIAFIAVLLYFIVPILNHKKYEEQRAALRKREEAFKQNQEKKTQSEATVLKQDKEDTLSSVEVKKVEAKLEVENKAPAKKTTTTTKAKSTSSTTKKSTTASKTTTAKKTNTTATKPAAKKTTTKK